MSIASRIFIWVSLLFFFASFAGKSNAYAVAKHFHAQCQQQHLSKVSAQQHVSISEPTDDICTQDAGDVDSDDHQDDVIVSAVLNFAAVIFLQQHPRLEYLPTPPEQQEFAWSVPRYILFHSLVIPPAA